MLRISLPWSPPFDQWGVDLIRSVSLLELGLAPTPTKEACAPSTSHARAPVPRDAHRGHAAAAEARSSSSIFRSGSGTPCSVKGHLAAPAGNGV